MADVRQFGAWRLSAIHAVEDLRLDFDLVGEGWAIDGEGLSEDAADRVVEAVLDRVVVALENEYAPQLHQNAHPADAITKLFELPGHEGLDLRRTYGT